MKTVALITLLSGLLIFITGYGLCDENNLVVDEKGNVGIGTENPSNKLEVNGGLTVTSPSSSFNGVTELNWGNYISGNVPLQVSFQHKPGSTFEITAMFAHYGKLATHGCVRKSFVANHHNGDLSIVDLINTSSENSGKWNISRNGNQIIIKKTAGSYTGGGFYSITVRGNSIVSVD